jgi:hypothetical protein
MVDLTQRPFNNYRSVDPLDAKDVFRFSQLNETAKDVFIIELRRFFDYTTADGLTKIKEIPNIQKFSIGSSSNDVGLETVVRTIISYGDTLSRYPMIAVTSSTYKERRMGIGGNFSGNIQSSASIVSKNKGPWDLTGLPDDAFMTIETAPEGLGLKRKSTIVLDKRLFNQENLTNLSSMDIARVINKTQALYYNASYNSDDRFILSAGGVLAKNSDNAITILEGPLLDFFGFEPGDTISTRDLPVKQRYITAADMTINIDVIADDPNTRVALSDIVAAYFSYYIQDHYFQYFGRSYFDPDRDPPELYRIAYMHNFSWSSETVTPRQGGEQFEYIYAVRGSFPIYIEDFIDKNLKSEPVWMGDVNFGSDSPVTGDYGEPNTYRIKT